MGKNKNAAQAPVENKTAVENKPATGTQAPETDIEAQIKEKNSLNAEYFNEAAEAIAKERKDTAVAEAKQLLARAEFTNAAALLGLRLQRAREKAVKAFLNSSKELLEEAKAGKLTKIETDKKFDELIGEKDKALTEARGNYNDAMRELKRNFNRWECWSWEINWGF